MSRPGAIAIRGDLEATGSPHALLAFLMLSHPSLREPIRVVSDVMDYLWDGERYTGMPFDLNLLSDNEQAPVTQLRVQNVDRRIGKALRALPDRVSVQLTLLSSADFDLTQDPRAEIGTATPVYGFRFFELIDVEVNAQEITGRVFLRDYGQEPFGLLATQSRAPGLFR